MSGKGWSVLVSSTPFHSSAPSQQSQIPSFTFEEEMKRFSVSQKKWKLTQAEVPGSSEPSGQSHSLLFTFDQYGGGG